MTRSVAGPATVAWNLLSHPNRLNVYSIVSPASTIRMRGSMSVKGFSARASYHDKSKTSNNRNDQQKIGKRSTCRKPPYLIHSPQQISTRTEDVHGTGHTTTPYTINDSVCPPTNPYKLKRCIENHFHTLDTYLTMKPIAKHTLQAFAIANEFVNRFFAKKGKNENAGIILDR